MSASKWKQYPEYKDMNLIFIDQIPTHWSLQKLSGYILNEKPKKFDGNKNYFSTFDVSNGIAISSEKVSFHNRPSRADILVRKGDIIQSKMKDSNKALIINSEMNEQLVSTGFFQMRSNEVGNFLYFWIQSDNFLCIRDYFSTGSTQKAANLSDINSSYVPIPPENEKIATFLNKQTRIIQTAITKLKQKMLILEEKRSALITQAVTKGLNLDVPMKYSGTEWIGEFPEHWTRVKLGHLSTRIGDGLHGTPKYVDHSDYRFINGNNLVNSQILFKGSTKFVSYEEYQKHHISLDDSSLVLSINGTIGVSAFYNGEKVILGKSAAYINCKTPLCREFLHQYIQSTFIQNWMLMEAGGTTIPNLSLESIRNMPILCPPIEEQNEIFQHLEGFQTNFLAIKYSLVSKIEKLREYRTALISAAVTGKIDVRSL